MADGHCMDNTDLEHSIITGSFTGQHESRIDIFINGRSGNASIIIFKV